VEMGKLNLAAPAFTVLNFKPSLATGASPDFRLERITIRQLLQHTGGWDREKSFDPMFRSDEIATAVGTRAPADARAIIRYMLGRPLDFDPGTRYAYSNFGYCVLGRVIEAVAGTSYERFVQAEVLAPMGIPGMRLGHSRERQRARGEVTYYTPENATAPSVFLSDTRKVPAPYGGFYLEAMDAHGGWIASAVDLARFLASLRPGGPAILKPETLRTMLAAPPVPTWRKPDGSLEDSYYSCGWMVRPKGGAEKANLWHTGSLPGTYALMVRRWDDIAYVALFNQRSSDWQTRDEEIDPLLNRAADAIIEWPIEDLFRQYSPRK
jgi:N-acyl-D-amino-acid deacylase